MLLLWLLILAYIIGFAPLRFHIVYANRGIDDHFLLEMVFFHVFRWKKEISLIRPRLEQWGIIARVTEAKPGLARGKDVDSKRSNWSIGVVLKSADRFRRRLSKYGLGVSLLSLFLPRRYLDYIHVVEAMENRGRFTQFHWRTRVGSTDAAMTAWLTGSVWGLKGQITGYLQHRYTFHDRPALEITPIFGEAVLDTWIDCIFELKVGHIITVGFGEWVKIIFTKRRDLR